MESIKEARYITRDGEVSIYLYKFEFEVIKRNIQEKDFDPYRDDKKYRYKFMIEDVGIKHNKSITEI